MSSPSASLTIHEPGKLASDQRAVFERLKAILSGPDADKRYNAIPESRKGKLISVDVARLVSPEFQTWDAKVRHTASTGNPAGAYAHDRLLRELAKPRSGTKRLIVTAGGAGSGKTTLLGLDAPSLDADLVFDNQLRDLDRALAILKAAHLHGWEAEFMYVHRPFPDVVRAVIERSQRTGRWNLLAELPRSHMQAQSTVLALRRVVVFSMSGEKSNPMPSMRFSAQYNASKGVQGPPRGSRVAFRDLMPKGPYHLADEERLLKDIPPILRRAVREGIICEELATIIGKGLPPG